jgi:uncharacterized protein (TIGR04255 family)
MPNPKEVKFCPIIDSVVEVRFNTHVPASAVFGIIYGVIGKDFKDPESLPILQIPEPIRLSDPNFKYKAHYKLIDEHGNSLQIGPDVLVFASKYPYPGWDMFKEFVYSILGKILALNIISEFSRLGFRFINLFTDVGPEDFKIDLTIINKDVNPQNVVIRTEIVKEDNLCVLQYSTNSQIVNNITGEVRTGHLVDIDVSKDFTGDTFKDNFVHEIETSHNIEKTLFFSLLHEQLLNRLQPTYD